MTSPAENPKAARGEASRHTYNASLAHSKLDRYLRSCFRTNVPQHTPARGSRPLGAAAWGRLPVGPTRVAEKFECKTCRTEFAGSTRRAIG
jgi:hypothetical protein